MQIQPIGMNVRTQADAFRGLGRGDRMDIGGSGSGVEERGSGEECKEEGTEWMERGRRIGNCFEHARSQ